MKPSAWAKAFLALAVASYSSSEAIRSAYTGPRIGAVCRDGWHSNSTGSGACSHHGGVDHWIYAEYDGFFKPFCTPLHYLAYAGGVGAALSSVIALLRSPKQPPPKPPVTGDSSLGSCPRCQGALVRKRRRRDGRPFVGCCRYPLCRYTRDGES
jgi:hypothetical protein